MDEGIRKLCSPDLCTAWNRCDDQATSSNSIAAVRLTDNSLENGSTCKTAITLERAQNSNGFSGKFLQRQKTNTFHYHERWFVSKKNYHVISRQQLIWIVSKSLHSFLLLHDTLTGFHTLFEVKKNEFYDSFFAGKAAMRFGEITVLHSEHELTERTCLWYVL